MLEAISGALLFVLGGFLFWPVLAVLCFCTFSTVRGRSYWWATLWVGVLMFCIAFRVTDFGQYILDNPLMMLAWFAGYIAIGVVVSVGKWIYVVKDSKRDLQRMRDSYAEYQEKYEANEKLKREIDEGKAVETFGRKQDRQVREYEEYKDFNAYFRSLHSSQFKIRELRGKEVIVLDTDNQPIPEWVMFWPITLLTYVFEPVWSVVERIVSHLGHMYDSISAKMLSA